MEIDYLLLEDGGSLLQEDTGKIELEDASVTPDVVQIHPIVPFILTVEDF